VVVPAHGTPANAMPETSSNTTNPAQAVNTFLYITTPPAT
jgi:hypothetical protein